MLLQCVGAGSLRSTTPQVELGSERSPRTPCFFYQGGGGVTSSLSQGMRPQSKQDIGPSQVMSEPLQAAAPQRTATSSQDLVTTDGQRTDLSGPTDKTLLMARWTHAKLQP